MFKRKARRTSSPTPIKAKPISQQGFGFEMPPEFLLVEIYFDQDGYSGESENFYSFYRDAGWHSPKGKPYHNWKVLATAWLKKVRTSKS